MADAQPSSDGSRKQQEGGGKKKDKQQQRKSAASSGDGAPSPSPSSQQVGDTAPTVPVASPQGATGKVVKKGAGDHSKKQGATPSKPADGAKQEKTPKQKGDTPATKPSGAETAPEGAPQKSKAQLKAERRAIQEAQRAAKEALKAEAAGGGGKKADGGAGAASAGKSQSASGAAEHPQKKDGEKSKTADKSKAGASGASGGSGEKIKKQKKAAANFQTEEELWAYKEKKILDKSLKIDNSVLNLGFQYFHHKIVGANARCLALMTTLREIISKYRTPEEKELARDLEKNFLNPCITYINECRPLSISMGNAIKHLKYHISQIPNTEDDETAIARLQGVIDNFIHMNILKAAEAVAMYADEKIQNDDVILVYAASSLIGHVLKTAYKKGKRFRVIVVEGRPRTEGKTMLRFLVRCGIPCSYVYIGSASHAMNEATKVFLGASAMFAIGDMHSRTGNSMIAALAKANNIPVLVCCETYKFTERVQLQTGDSNLHARGKDLLWLGDRPSVLADQEGLSLNLLNLMYDVTQSRYITALVTELGMLPCTSVPVVLRRQEDLVSES